MTEHKWFYKALNTSWDFFFFFIFFINQNSKISNCIVYAKIMQRSTKNQKLASGQDDNPYLVLSNQMFAGKLWTIILLGRQHSRLSSKCFWRRTYLSSQLLVWITLAALASENIDHTQTLAFLDALPKKVLIWMFLSARKKKF